ncbi:Acg family FMN-binding oxidoreductase [Couchioplanes caeruleus]|nr:nitroreductase family protein [Couchioplanes caeruleus]
MNRLRTEVGAGMPSLLSPAVIAECVRTATAAPSLHNSQPWFFRIRDGAVEVYADRRRKLDVVDPAGREMIISVGAAVFTLRLAVRREGFLPEVESFPDAADPDFVARVSIGPACAPSAAEEALAAAIERRHTNRWPFTQQVVPSPVLGDLRDAARDEGTALTVADAAARDTIVRLSRLAGRRLRARGGYHAETSHWTARGAGRSDGVPITAIGPWDVLETVPTRDFGLLRPQPPTIGRFEPYPTMLVLSTRGDDRAEWLRAGQALQRVLLAATDQNLVTTPVSQPVEVPGIRRRLTATDDGRWAQMMIRVGYGRPAAATPRRPLSEVLLSA